MWSFRRMFLINSFFRTSLLSVFVYLVCVWDSFSKGTLTRNRTNIKHNEQEKYSRDWKRKRPCGRDLRTVSERKWVGGMGNTIDELIETVIKRKSYKKTPPEKGKKKVCQ